MDYLNSLSQSISAGSRRRSKNSSNIGDMLKLMSESLAMTPPKQAAAPIVSPQSAAPAAGAKANSPGHHPGDGHKHASGLDSSFHSALQRLIQDSGGKVSIGSGYRSIAEQQVLYDRYKRGVKGQAPAAAPGKSNHNHGLAADLKYRNAAARSWVHANAAKYGLRFPMSYEPWHIEPVDARARRKKK